MEEKKQGNTNMHMKSINIIINEDEVSIKDSNMLEAKIKTNN